MIAQVTPVSVPTLSPGHRAKLRSSGLTDDQINHLPHRTATAAEAKAATGHEVPGLLLGYLSQDGKPYQILTGKWARRPYARLRPDWDKASPEKRSDYADGDGELPKYLSPKDCGSRPYFSPGFNWAKLKPSRLVLLTEGEFKGDAGCAHGFATIAGAGVSAYVDRKEREDWTSGGGSGWDTEEPEDDRMPVSRFLPELEVIPWKFRPVGIIFDSDVTKKFQVRKSIESLISHVRARAGEGFPVILPNELDGSKNGLDDFLVRHGREALDLLIEAYWSQQHNRNAMVKYVPAVKSGGRGTKVTGGRNKNGEPHDGSEFCVFKLTEPEPHTKALMTWAVLKERWAYRPGLGWYHWQGKRWEPTNDVIALGSEMAQFFDAQNWQLRQGLYAYCQEEMSRRCLVPESQWDSEHYLSFSNGVLDTRTNEFKPHDSRRYCTSVLPYDYDPFATCPAWLNFLGQTTGGDDQLQQLLRAWLRWILAPKDRQHKFSVEKSLDLVGRKGSGKGTFLDVLVQLIGEDSCGSASPDVFATPEGLGQLIDKKIAIDADSSGYMSGVGNFNKVVSNEAVGVKKLFKDKLTTRLGVVVVRAYNDFIAVPSSGTEGLDRRLCVVPFSHPPATQDHDLSDRLRGELSGIFAWAWAMPLAQSKAIIRWSGAIKAVQTASIDRFASDHPEFKYLLDDYPAGRQAVQAFNLYEGYVAWAKRNGHKSCSNTKFGTLLNELGIHHYKGNGGAIFYDVPDMRNDYDLVGYLRISPNSSEGCPANLFDLPAQNPCPVSVSEGSEGQKTDQPTSNPCPISVSEGSEGLDPQSAPRKNKVESVVGHIAKIVNTEGLQPVDRPIAKGEQVEMNGAVTWYQRGSTAIDKKWLLNQHKEAEVIPLDSLPEWSQDGFRQWEGPWQVVGMSDDCALLRAKNGKAAWIGLEGLYVVEEVLDHD
jgi:putative DNA primase/helicase